MCCGVKCLSFVCLLKIGEGPYDSSSKLHDKEKQLGRSDMFIIMYNTDLKSIVYCMLEKVHYSN